MIIATLMLGEGELTRGGISPFQDCRSADDASSRCVMQPSVWNFASPKIMKRNHVRHLYIIDYHCISVYLINQPISCSQSCSISPASPAAGFELPHCGLRGELPLDGDLGVVLVCHLVALQGLHVLSLAIPPRGNDGLIRTDLPLR